MSKNNVEASPGELLDEIAALSKQLEELGCEVVQLSARRRAILAKLHTEGYSHARLAVVMGVSRGRVFQLLHPTGAIPTTDRT